MGLLGKIMKAGVVVGATYAAVKVSEKYSQNNPEGVSDPAAKATAIKEAAGEVYQEVSSAVQEKAPAVVETIKEKAPGVVETIKEKAPGVAEAIKEKAPGVVEAIKEKAPGVVESVKETAQAIFSKADPAEAVDAEFSAVVDETSAAPEEEIKEEEKAE